jgi:MFS-type transporter involved in bile tolerance (Atg22 family)
MGGKFGFIFGPLVWGLVVLVFEDLNTIKYRIAVGSLLLFLFGGLYLLKKVPDKIT